MGKSIGMKANRSVCHVPRRNSLSLFAIALMAVAVPWSASAQESPALRAAKQYTDQHSVEILKDFAQLLAMPDVAKDTPAQRQDIEKNAAYIQTKLQTTRC